MNLVDFVKKHCKLVVGNSDLEGFIPLKIYESCYMLIPKEELGRASEEEWKNAMLEALEHPMNRGKR